MDACTNVYLIKKISVISALGVGVSPIGSTFVYSTPKALFSKRNCQKYLRLQTQVDLKEDEKAKSQEAASIEVLPKKLAKPLK